MTETLDLDDYCRRIGYDGPREPTLETLSAIHALHPAAIPFENLDPLLGRPVRLDIETLQAKMVAQRRGGYCFEHNTLFRAVLETIGFAVTPLIARVVWMAPPGRPLGARSHMLLKVDLAEGPMIADVGFGGQLASEPLKLAPGLEQRTGEAVLRLTSVGAAPFDALVLETRLPMGWTPMYRFTLEPAELADYEASNWFTATHPSSIFTHFLLAERLAPAGRTSLYNTRLTRRAPDGAADVAELTSADDLARVLDEDFDLETPVDAVTLFARLPQPGS